MYRRIAPLFLVLALAGGIAYPAAARDLSLSRLSGFTPHSLDIINVGFPISPIALHGHPLAVLAGRPMQLAGWAVDSRTHFRAGGVTVTVDDSKQFPAQYGMPRPDVAQYYHNRAYTDSGFSATIPTSNLSVGQHVLGLRILTNDRKAYYASSIKVVFVVSKTTRLPHLNALSTAAEGGIDAVNFVPFGSMHTTTFRAPYGEGVTLVGWAVDPRALGAARNVVAQVDGKQYFEGRYGFYRPDVAKHLRSRSYAASGFMLSIPTATLQIGTHTLRLLILSRDGKGYYTIRSQYHLEFTKG